MLLPLTPGKQLRRYNLRQHEKHNQPAPHQQIKTDVVPERDEREYRQIIQNASCDAKAAAHAGAPERNVEVADQPFVEAAVPGAPEGDGGGVVGDAADHVLRRVDAVHERPEAEQPPWEQQFQP